LPQKKPASRMKVIINADDFGFNSSVNDNVLDLISRRRITSTTIISNAPYVEDAVRRIPRNSPCSFGVHLNLTEFEPLTPSRHLGALSACVGQNGHFLGEDFLRSVNITSSMKKAFTHELRLQVEKISKLGVRISHFDSHNHIHTIPALFPVLKELQRHFGIRKVRNTWNVFSSRPAVTLILKKKFWSLALRHYYETTTTCGFTSLSTFYELATSRVLRQRSLEVMVHPGHPQFEKETGILSMDWEKNILFPVQLVSYLEL